MYFADFDREMIEDIFGLKQTFSSSVLFDWIELGKQKEINIHEDYFIKRLQQDLIYRVDYWNEIELIEHFVGPIFSIVNFNTLEFGLFSERELKAVVNEIEIKGKPDAVIAKGRYSPKIPYFCFHEYKKEQENKGDPQAQCLVAMLAARELNKNDKPIYGIVVKGERWYFMVLQGQEYAISNSYSALDEELFEIIKLLKHLKSIIEEYVNDKKNDNSICNSLN